MKVRVNYWIPKRTKDRLQKVALNSKRSMTSILEEALENYFTKFDKKKK